MPFLSSRQNVHHYYLCNSLDAELECDESECADRLAISSYFLQGLLNFTSTETKNIFSLETNQDVIVERGEMLAQNK